MLARERRRRITRCDIQVGHHAGLCECEEVRLTDGAALVVEPAGLLGSDGMSQPNVCLTMIVRDEERVIERCLKSVKPHIDSWAITDTGSNDRTMELIEKNLEGIPGKLYQEPWQNFGYNRNVAFQNAKEQGSFAFIIDADDIFTADDGFVWPDLEKHSHYEMAIEQGGSSWMQARLLATDRDWKWKGVVHEYPELLHGADPVRRITGAKVVSMPDGNRRMQDPIKKYTDDAKAIEGALKDEPDNARYLFYLAQSYRDSIQREKALVAYQRRVEVGGWDEETWYSMFQIGKMHDLMGNWDQAFLAYMDAYRFRPSRIEPILVIARHYRMKDHHQFAYMFAVQAKETPVPLDRLFMDMAAYDWLALDEYAICCYWLGKHEEALIANAKLLGLAPESQRPRILENLAFSQKALEEGNGKG